MISGREAMLIRVSHISSTSPHRRLRYRPQMTTCSELVDYEWLTGSEAGAVLAELDADKSSLHTAIARLRGRFTTTQTHLLLEQTDLRRRATAKFTQAHQMFFTRIALEQATDEWVAAYKASRFRRAVASSPPSLIADLCCGIG